jgi:hypothetical protein
VHYLAIDTIIIIMSEKSMAMSLVGLLLLALYSFAAAICIEHSSHSISFYFFRSFLGYGFSFLVYELSNNVRLAWRCDAGISDLS